MRRTLILLACAAGLAAPPRAWAQNEKAAADNIFREGQRLFRQGDTADACRHFEASLKLMNQIGVRLNLAVCYERLGKLLAAYVQFRAAELAARDASDPREGFARARRVALEGRLPQITVVLEDDVDVSGLQIALDGEPLDRGLLDVSFPVDPGAHQVTASAPGHEPWSIAIAAMEGTQHIVQVPRLQPTAAPAPASSAPVHRARPVQLRLSSPPPVTVMSEGATEGRPVGQMVGVGLGTVGVASLATAVLLRVWAHQAYDELVAKELCTEEGGCKEPGLPGAREARRGIIRSNIAAGVGLATLTSGVIVFLVSRRKERRAAPRVSPTVGTESVGFVLMGDF